MGAISAQALPERPEAVDAGTVAKWGRLQWEADVPRGTRLEVRARAGNTAEPDETWTDWVVVEGTGGTGVAAGLPATRWLQARVDMEPSRAGDSPSLRRIELFYQARNRAPVITDLSVAPAGRRRRAPGDRPEQNLRSVRQSAGGSRS